MEIDSLHFGTAHLGALRTFYADTLGCPVTNATSNEFTVEIGATNVTFSAVADGSDPFYHFAINIPQNQFDAAAAWLADRVELLSSAEAGERDIFFEDWNAHAVYCLDPADNILELIARHDLSNDSDHLFGSENFRRVSEIGLPVPNVRRAVETIRDNVGVSLRNNRSVAVTDTESFAAVGDEYGLFIVVKESRGWFPTRNQAAEVYPTSVGIPEATREYAFQDLPYRIYPS